MYIQKLFNFFALSVGLAMSIPPASGKGEASNVLYRFAEDGASFLYEDIISYKAINRSSGDELLVRNLNSDSGFVKAIRKGSLRPVVLKDSVALGRVYEF